MTDKKETKKEAPKVPANPETVQWTESQKELYLKIKGEIDELTRESANYMINNILFPKVQKFAEELNVDIRGQNWQVDIEKFQFIKVEKK